jgi:tRNA(Ile2)-agmatinylcytidine synthase
LQLKKQNVMHIGLDDTDSTKGGCTTYIAALLIESLEKLKVKFLDYPNLIRLNPNVPWKTRGNGALCLRINYTSDLEETIKETATSLIEQHSDLALEGTNPGIVFLQKKEVPNEITAFAKKTITDIVTLREATRLIKKFKAEALGFKTCRGIIGALAAIGETLQEDYTYELIAYRIPENRGLTRKVEKESIFEMEDATAPYTFNNVDSEKKRVIITPRGPDPILFGIRGETPEYVKKGFRLIKSLEPVERWLVFRTNQGTDAHLKKAARLNEIKPYTSVIARGFVSQNPRIIPLRHVILSIKDEIEEVDCAAYEPTGMLRKVARQLVPKDEIEVYGAVRQPVRTNPLTINLEKIRILTLQPSFNVRNPKCKKCGKRLKSMGKNKGFRCERCGTRFRHAQKTRISTNRELEERLYFTSTRSQRHLTKPLRRYGMEKNGTGKLILIENWHSLQTKKDNC